MSTRPIELLQVRILPKPSLPAGQPPRATKLARQAETFAALYGAPTGQSDEDEDPSGHSGGEADAQPLPPEDSPAPGDPDRPPEAPPREPEPRNTSGPASPASLTSQGKSDAASLSSRVVRACAGGEETNLRMEYLASIVARFCNSPSIADGGSWELRIGLNPSVLAETKLYLQLSSYRLLLRFETEHPRSKSLIYDNVRELSARLHSLMGEKIDVEVTVW